MTTQAEGTRSEYALDSASDLGREQLGYLEQLLDQQTTGVLAATGVGPGWRCLELGIGMPPERARAHHGIADARHDVGDTAGARRHWRKAVDIYESLGSAHAQRVRERITQHSSPGDAR